MITATHYDGDVSGLASQRMQGLGVKLRATSRVAHILRGVLGWFEGIVVVSLNNVNRSFVSQSVWFRGAAQEVLRVDQGEDDPRLPAMIGKQYERIDGLKENLRKMRREFETLQAAESSPRLQSALDRAMGTSADLYDALESYRWALMEVEANRASVETGFAATSASELDAVFDRIASEK